MAFSMTQARRYHVYGLLVASDVAFSSVAEAPEEARAADLTISLVNEGRFRPRATGAKVDADEWIAYDVLADGSVYIRIASVFEAIVDRDGRRAICVPVGTPDELAFEANLLNFMASTALTLQGEETLHATVVEWDGKAIGLLGPSGAGKSTLAAYLVGRRAELVTDDMLRVQFTESGVCAYPGPHRLKLFEEPAQRYLPEAHRRGSFNALSGKSMIEPRAGTSLERRPLAALFWLGDESRQSEVTVKRLEGAELAKTLIGSAMSFRYQAPDRLARQLKFSERLARALPIYALIYPRQFEIMDRVYQCIDDTVKG